MFAPKSLNGGLVPFPFPIEGLIGECLSLNSGGFVPFYYGRTISPIPFGALIGGCRLCH